jgi:hypothetical protein
LAAHNYLPEIDSLTAVRDRRNAFAHDVGEQATWNDWDFASSVIERHLLALGVVRVGELDLVALR